MGSVRVLESALLGRGLVFTSTCSTWPPTVQPHQELASDTVVWVPLAAGLS